MSAKLKMQKVRPILFAKVKIAAKEADEVEYYLQLILKSEYLEVTDLPVEQIKSIIKVLSKIISSAKSS